jgi:hypothetical protein
MTQISVVHRKKESAAAKTRLKLDITIEFGDDAESAASAVDKLVAILRVGMSEADVQKLLKHTHRKLKAALKKKALCAGGAR